MTLTGRNLRPGSRVLEEVSNYMAVTGGTVLRLPGNDYYIKGEAKEWRFGLADEPKYWVKQAIDLTWGIPKIIKFPFHERFSCRLGGLKFSYFRDPDKESEILDLVLGDRRFMQGITLPDRTGARVRVIDRIEGRSLFNEVASLELPHERYYHEVLPGLITRLLPALEAIACLHDRGGQHGDIRSDHILIDADTGEFRWIDFDCRADFADYDVWCMGNVLAFVLAGGFTTLKDARRLLDASNRDGSIPTTDDVLLLERRRLANLRLVHAHVHPALDQLLMRFSVGTPQPFGEARELVGALAEAATRAWPGSFCAPDPTG